MTVGSLAAGGKGCASHQPRTEIRIHAHSIILASCSEMMRSWLSRWSDRHSDDEEPDADGDELDTFPQLDSSASHLSLDGVEEDEELLTCMLLADRWLLPDCVSACAARLQATPAGSLCWRVRAALLALPLGLSAASPPVAQLQARAEASLMRAFRCPELILEDADNWRLLLSLPADRLKQLLLERQDVQVRTAFVHTPECGAPGVGR
ncbi:hypothetical protein VOLCADRAFT_99049 [Volvox carteri f. nagariensis]|uniref:BTB domain-containing protein n=1 Tax=Volvox carteri f. nagariensis TaxID=3068 RepID=D8UGX4_VOLCA|nr:uncharacterized protein VOLCADRAFT_99049 [Volvox carteri f. nagariensis]EFJ41028.1 hypothetical protein VOLCADRAFT_99049 [Volvox carteri f. nagariensis]|eukprot:XP_002957892.1 hypothetical protein VOLCADRAFT_99049 [Volvox carteri f. nagariensis]